MVEKKAPEKREANYGSNLAVNAYLHSNTEKAQPRVEIEGADTDSLNTESLDDQKSNG